MTSSQPSRSLTEAAYETLRADLLACRLRPGDRLKISDLCQRLGANLSAVREALARLTADGLVEAEPQRGFRVAPISQADLRDLTAVRIDIEAMCLRRAIAVGDLAWEAQVVAAFHRMTHLPERDPADPVRINEAWAQEHANFHEALVAACDSPWLLRMRALLYAQSERYRRLSAPLGGVPRDLDHEHRDIMNATLARSADLAAALMGEHLRLTTKLLLDAGAGTARRDAAA